MQPITGVCFHSLPDAKRYAETPDEHAELLRRHHGVLTDLRAAVTRPNGSFLWVFTTSWSDTADRAAREPDPVSAMPVADHWQCVRA